MMESEKKGGAPKALQSMMDFRSTLDNCGLQDPGFTGYPFTWSNGRCGEDNVQERLDRACVTEEWLCLYPFISVEHNTRSFSDHCVVVVEFDEVIPEASTKGKRLFRFEESWCNEPSCHELVASGWDAGSNIVEKIKHVSSAFQEANFYNTSSIRKKIKHLEESITILKHLDLTDAVKLKIQNAQAELDNLLKNEEILWRQRSRAIWLKEGDLNTKFFHRKASQRKRRNMIFRIRDDHNRVHSDLDGINNTITSYFRNLFKASNLLGVEEVCRTVKYKVSDLQCEILSKPFSIEDVKMTLDSMHPSKAPGPNGMTALFFQNFWNKVGAEVSTTALQILNEEIEKKIRGLKIGKHSPPITHLFFADDSILFCQATDEAVQSTISIIHSYEQAFGQLVNLEKTELSFSRNVSDIRRNMIQNRMGVKVVESHDKYLGIPTLVGLAMDAELMPGETSGFQAPGALEQKWNSDKVHELFLPFEAKMIVSIPLSWRNIDDRLLWPFEKHDCYSVRSAYHFLMDQRSLESSSSQYDSRWRKLWDLTLPPKVKVFFWRLCHGAIASNLNIFRRGVHCDVNCTKCCDKVESVSHLFLNCPVAKECWFVSPLGFFPSLTDQESFLDWLWDRLAKDNEDTLSWIAMTCWTIWQRRNAFVFDHKNLNLNEAVSQATRLLNDFRQVNFSNPSPSMPITSIWKPPQGNVIKINTDAARISDREWGVGVVARDSSSNLIFVAASKVLSHDDPSLAEALALRWAMGIAYHNNLPDVEFESDCLVIINTFHKGNRDASLLENVIKDCESLSKCFNSFSLTHIKRDGNRVAHHVAKNLHSAETEFWFSNFPFPVVNLVQNDVLRFYNFND
ncbi:ribonuclease H [Senna tora]|uniref:Ribonuclease H n=1 Tax=Senna tora TaxID=362788 RepID=A0A834TZJ8_9FABA|nr:ribonuclease H [Senna tora]